MEVVFDHLFEKMDLTAYRFLWFYGGRVRSEAAEHEEKGTHAPAMVIHMNWLFK